MRSLNTLDFVKMRIPDCLVKYNKIGGGNGEARLYVGGITIRNWNEFFGDFELKCFFDKVSLKEYLLSVEFEYKNPSQPYRRDIKSDWLSYINELEDFPDYIYFNIFPNNDTNNRNGNSRFYIKSQDIVYDFFRRIALPNITSLLIQKVLIDNEVQLWFRLYLNDVGNDLDRQIADDNIEQIENDNTIPITEKESIIKARIGQGLYRTLIVDKYKQCIITGIDDERVLIASHIKPWISSNNNERISRDNGLLLSPTFDKLFDRGFISFKNSGEIMLSNFFSDANFGRVHLSQGDKFDLKMTNGMKTFLDYHRDMEFLK